MTGQKGQGMKLGRRSCSTEWEVPRRPVPREGQVFVAGSYIATTPITTLGERYRLDFVVTTSPGNEWWLVPTTSRSERSLADEEWLGERLRYSTIALRECIEVNPNKRGGIPVIRGTRFTVAQLLAEIAEGRSLNEIAEDFEIDLHLLKKLLESMSIYLDRPAFK